MNRRLAIIGLTSALAGVAMGPLVFSKRSAAVRTQQSGPHYVEPTWWDGMPRFAKRQMLAFDFVFWQIENIVPPPSSAPAINAPFNAAGNFVLSTMMQPGQLELKTTLAVFLSHSRRWQYLPHLMPGLNPSIADRGVRMTVSGSLNRLFDLTGPSGFTTEVEQALVSAYATEADLHIKNRLDRLLNLLGTPH